MTEFTAIIDEFRIMVIKFHFNLLPPIYTLLFQAVSFCQVSPPKSCTHFSSTHYMPHAQPTSVGHHNVIWHGVQIMYLLFMQFSPVFFHFFSVSPRYSPQHYILTQPQYNQPCFTSLYKNWQNYIYVYFNLHVLRYQRERQKILDRIAAEILSI